MLPFSLECIDTDTVIFGVENPYVLKDDKTYFKIGKFYILATLEVQPGIKYLNNKMNSKFKPSGCCKKKNYLPVYF